MNAEDWFFGVFLGPPLIVAAWVVCFHVWRSGLNVAPAVDWFTGDAGLPGYHASLLPICVSMTTGWLAAMGQTLRGIAESPPAWSETFVNYTGVASFAFLLLGFWLWLTKWPTFMLPPQFRRKDRSDWARR